jgi:spore germination protein YaaH
MKRFFILLFILTPLFFTESALAATPKKAVTQPFDVAVWIPYWRKTDGASSTLANLDKVTQISPFSFELQRDGSIKNALKIDEEPWLTLIEEAKKKKIKVYPSILSYPSTYEDKQAVYNLLASKKRRAAHVKEIATLVKKYNFDGIDIDYEAKIAEIKPYFAAFLAELAKELHKSNKKLICTIEPRTPPESRYATTSKDVLSKVEYANDYKAIGKACDQIRIMAYDQSTDDAKLVKENRGAGLFYAPVADIDWVKKVVTIALWDMPAKKILLGVPTYGNKYEVTITNNTDVKYKRIGSMNFSYADELLASLKITPVRNTAGEVNFTYSTSTGINGEALGAVKQYLVWYSDAEAIRQKVALAKLYKLGGVAVFKIDGGHDPNIWNVLK